MKILVKKVPGLVLPKRGTKKSSGYDVVATSEPKIVGEKFERPLDGIMAWSRIDYVEYQTNITIAPQPEMRNGKLTDFDTLWFPRSSISAKNLILANSIGLVDVDYRGVVNLRFKYIFQPEDCIMLPEGGRNKFYAIISPERLYKIGDRIAQIKASEVIDVEFGESEELDATERSSGGFGSTGA